MAGHLTISEDIQVPVTGFGKSGHLDETSMIYSASLLEPSLLVSRLYMPGRLSHLDSRTWYTVGPIKKLLWADSANQCCTWRWGEQRKVGISHCNTLAQFSVVTKMNMDRAQSSQLSACRQWLQERSSRME